MHLVKSSVLGAVLAIGMANLAQAEFQLSLYSGLQSAPDGNVDGTTGDDTFDFDVEWNGNSTEVPPYFGFRLTWWQSERLGYGIELNHAKVAASDSTLRNSGFSDLEFTDGLNLLTVNGFHRWSQENRRWDPYIGGGVGLAIPRVDVEIGANDTFDYQITGPAVVFMAGATYELDESWSVFGEYKGSYSSNTADLEDGGELETDVITNAVNVGLTFNF
nr:outer membrane beta-barrel protein [Pseudaestuariivita rosea]